MTVPYAFLALLVFGGGMVPACRASLSQRPSGPSTASRPQFNQREAAQSKVAVQPREWSAWDASYDYRIADVNGDGKADIIGRRGDDIQVGLSTGSSFATSAQWSTWDPAYDYQIADVNGDGKADIIGRRGDDIQVGLSTGSSFATSAQWSTWDPAYDYQIADVNGDGKADIIGRHLAGHGPWFADVQVGLSTGQQFATSTSWSNWEDFTYLADVNGDGAADMIGRIQDKILVSLSTRSLFAKDKMVWSTWDPAYDYRLGDFDGDGKADLIGRGYPGIPVFQVGISTGTSFAPSNAIVVLPFCPDSYLLGKVSNNKTLDFVFRMQDSIRVIQSDGNTMPAPAVCGDGQCDPIRGESLANCPADCSGFCNCTGSSSGACCPNEMCSPATCDSKHSSMVYYVQFGWNLGTCILTSATCKVLLVSCDQKIPEDTDCEKYYREEPAQYNCFHMPH